LKLLETACRIFIAGFDQGAAPAFHIVVFAIILTIICYSVLGP
jgi:predicted esterase